MLLSKTKNHITFIKHFLSFLLWLSLFISLITTGCIFQSKNEQVAGGAEDFPNTLALGAAMAGGVSDQPEWDQFSIVPTALPSSASTDSLIIPADTTSLSTTVSLTKSAANSPQVLGNLQDTVYFDYSDTATLKIIRRIHLQETNLRILADTTTFSSLALFNPIGSRPQLILESKGMEYAKVSKRLKKYLYENLDSIGGFDRATFYDQSIIPGSRFMDTTATSIHIGITSPGPDGNFNTVADNNPIYHAFYLVKSINGKNLDTTEFYEIRDADKDGFFYGKGDSGIVVLDHKVPSPPFRPSVNIVTQKIRMVIFRDGTKSYPIFFNESRIEKDGKAISFSIKGNGTDSAFNPGDTSLVNLHISYPAENAKLEKSNFYKILIGSKPKQFKDNKLILYRSQITWRTDSLISATLSFKPDQPIISNELSWNGEMQADINFVNGDSGKLTGRFQDKIIDAELVRTKKDGQIRKHRIKWDYLGKLISQ